MDGIDVSPRGNVAWRPLGLGSRVLWALLAMVIVGATIALAAWALAPRDELLFGNLPPHQLPNVVRQLEQAKLAYRVGDDGRSLYVEGGSVHATRLRLMGSDAALQGAVGLELFDTSDFGTTEFAQKVNYQRALQGELARTVMALSEVESARVHLALPEEGVFRRSATRAKASIVIAIREGAALQRPQVAGIQKLVSSAVPGIAPEDVTVADHRGVALSGGEPAVEGIAPSLRLEMRREVEEHLARKATQVLESAYGKGNALVTVDATLDLNQTRTTIEDVLTPPARKGELPSGVVHRERETVRDDGKGNAGPSQREVDYQLGRRMEQVVGTPGSVVRLHVAAVLKSPLGAAQVDDAKALLAASVGARRDRGDSVVLHTLDRPASPVDPRNPADAGPSLASTPTAEAPSPVATPAAPPATAASSRPDAWARLARAAPALSVESGAVLVAVVAALWLLASTLARRRRVRARASAPPDRQLLLAQVRGWLQPDGDLSVRPLQRR